MANALEAAKTRDYPKVMAAVKRAKILLRARYQKGLAKLANIEAQYEKKGPVTEVEIGISPVQKDPWGWITNPKAIPMFQPILQGEMDYWGRGAQISTNGVGQAWVEPGIGMTRRRMAVSSGRPTRLGCRHHKESSPRGQTPKERRSRSAGRAHLLGPRTGRAGLDVPSPPYLLARSDSPRHVINNPHHVICQPSPCDLRVPGAG